MQNQPVYLQNMSALKDSNILVHKPFAELGFYTVHRSNKYWGVLWTDLITDQVLIRSIKSRGGLSEGCGTIFFTSTCIST